MFSRASVKNFLALHSKFEWLQELAAIRTHQEALIVAMASYPYEGCFHEPQVWWFGVGTKGCFLVPLYVSAGYLQDLSRLESTRKDMYKLLTVLCEHPLLHDIDVYELHDYDVRRCLPEQFIQRIAERYDEDVAGLFSEFGCMQYVCDCCGRKVRVTMSLPQTDKNDFYGVGGVAVATDHLYCNSCFDSRRCSCCGEFQAPGKVLYKDDKCEHCTSQGECIDCGKMFPDESLKHGLCDDCADCVLSAYKKLRVVHRVPDSEVFVPRCSCGRPIKNSPVDYLCRECYFAGIGDKVL